jgi:TRAP-type mannitol/chloroaromatic compound transport system substrate-binding protein
MAGAIECAMSADAYNTGKDLTFGLNGMIAADLTWDEMMVYFYSDNYRGTELAEKLHEDYGVKYIVWGLMHSEALYSSKRKIVEPGDMEGMTYRGVGWTGMIIQEPEFGARGVLTPVGDIYTSLERGVIEGCELSSPDMNYDFGLHEVTRYLGFPGVHQLTQTAGFAINMDVWNDLPVDLQTIVKMCAASYCLRYAAFQIARSAEYIPLFEEAGVEVVRVSLDTQLQWKAVSDRLAEAEAAKNPKFKEMWDEHKKIMGDVRRYIKLQTPDW